MYDEYKFIQSYWKTTYDFIISKICRWQRGLYYEPVIINNIVIQNVRNVAVGSSSNILMEGQYLSSC